MKTIQLILDWSEVWSPLIPLTIYILIRPKARWAKPLFLFLIVTLVFGIAIDVMWKRYSLGLNQWFEKYMWWWWDTTPSGKKVLKNNIFYNLNSLARLIFFSMFFTYFYPVFKRMYRWIPWTFLILMAINFIWFENIKDFSSRQHAVEAAILLSCCLLYFYKTTMDENVAAPAALAEFRVVTGLTLYTAINFFIFLFYKYLMASPQFKQYAQEIWNVHNISFIILNLFIAAAFIKAKKNG